MSRVHDSASQGYESAADAYVSGRPDYPSEAAHWLRKVMGLAPDKTVLEVGAGTGKFTAMLKDTGARVLALEPVAAMRAELAKRHGDAEIMGGLAESIPLSGASVDAVVCAQAFHWFATREALAEIRRVLKSGGMLGLIWNVRDETVPWVAALSAITNEIENDAPRFQTGAWRRLFPAKGFLAVEERHAAHSHIGTSERVIVQRTLSVSYIAASSADQREAVERRVRALIEATPELTGSSETAFPYRTSMFAYRKIQA